MISRKNIETILKINGVSPTSADEQIRSILLSARYSDDEVDTALMVLREDTKTKHTRVDGLHKVFRTGESLKSDEIATLLGIDVTIEDRVNERSKRREISFGQYFFVWIASVLVATSGILVYMYLHKIGIFHPSVYLIDL
ncbi:hypothetical protein GW937_00630 [Candidatus Kaiserbacteria bacterium]|nr:hypothetical protein [Candidatus Kaiserbacteria bacterium]NCT01900.1 hypothetical protein [Candidatus Parcubacteria bacterium]